MNEDMMLLPVSEISWRSGFQTLEQNDGAIVSGNETVNKGLDEFSVLLPTKNGNEYHVNSDTAVKAFKAFAEVGKRIQNGGNVIHSLIPFLQKFGVPTDYVSHIPLTIQDKDDASNNIISIAQIIADAKIAYTCLKLSKDIKDRNKRSISELAIPIKFNQNYAFTWTRNESWVHGVPRVQRKEIPSQTSSEWIGIAYEWLLLVAEWRTPHLMVQRSGNKLAVAPAGLNSAMWFSFFRDVQGSYGSDVQTRNCKYKDVDGQVCGEMFYLNSPRDRNLYCETHRRLAPAERVRRFRNKPKS